jgi:Ca2+-transporting ATPase
VADTPVFARIEPLHKLRIVKAFQKRGEVVAMTGDGVNDAPALKSADIGIAMGITGTDVAKEAAAMVLADDNFASVVAAVEEGRAIFDRLRNVIFFLLATGLGSLLAIILAVGWTGVSPLVAVQIIWVNLVTGTIIAIPLGLEPKLGNELQRPPRHPKVGLVFPGLIRRTILVAFLMAVPIAVLFSWALANRSLAEAQTLAFCAMVMVQWLLVYTARSDEISPFRISFLRNRWLLASLAGALLLQLAVIYLPFLQPVFKTAPLGWDEWGMITGASLAVFVLEASLRVFFPRIFLKGKWRPGK